MHLALAVRDVRSASVAVEVWPEPGTVQAGNYKRRTRWRKGVMGVKECLLCSLSEEFRYPVTCPCQIWGTVQAGNTFQTFKPNDSWKVVLKPKEVLLLHSSNLSGTQWSDSLIKTCTWPWRPWMSQCFSRCRDAFSNLAFCVLFRAPQKALQVQRQ